MKILITAIVAVLVTLGIVSAVGKFVMPGMFDKAEDGAGVRVEAATRGELIEFVSASGEIEPETKVSISARVSARITEIPFDEGKTVIKGNAEAKPPVVGSVLVKFDAKDLEAAYQSAQAHYQAQKAGIEVAQARIEAQDAQIKGSRIQLNEAQRDLRRQLQLLESHDVSQSIVDAAQSKVDGMQAQLDSSVHSLSADKANLIVMRHNLDAADADIRRAEDNRSYATIYSPIDGVVTKVNTEIGELAVMGTMNNPGTVLLEVADLSKILLVARVDESSIAKVQVGQKAKVHIQAYDTETFEGVVQKVALATTEVQRDGTKYYEAEILLKTDGRRIPSGLTADADIETKRHEDVLRIPSQSVVGRPVDALPQDVRGLPEVDKNKSYATVVYRLRDGKAVVTPVKVGPSDLTHTVIIAGLSEGDRVITGPYKVLESIQHDQKFKEEQPGAAKGAGTQAVASK